MQRRRPAAAAVAVAALVALSGCSGPGAAPAPPAAAAVGLTNCDVPVALPRPAGRAVAVNQPAVELLLALGLGDRMVGYAMSEAAVLPELEAEKAKVKPFDTEFPSFESVLEREPDLVYTTFDYTFTAEGVADRKRFTDLGIATYQSPSECGGQAAEQQRALTLDDLYAEIGQVASLFGVPDRGTQLADRLRTRADAAARAGAAPAGVTLAWWYSSTTTPYIAGCCGAPGLMTQAVGATNAFADSRQYWPEIGWEALLQRDPDVLVLADLQRGEDGDSAAAKIRFLESDPVASKLTAVQKRRYVVLDGTTMDPSIRNVEGIERLAEGLRSLAPLS